MYEYFPFFIEFLSPAITSNHIWKEIFLNLLSHYESMTDADIYVFMHNYLFFICCIWRHLDAYCILEYSQISARVKCTCCARPCQKFFKYSLTYASIPNTDIYGSKLKKEREVKNHENVNTQLKWKAPNPGQTGSKLKIKTRRKRKC